MAEVYGESHICSDWDLFLIGNGTTPACYHCGCDLSFCAIETESDVIDCKNLPDYADYLRYIHTGATLGPAG